MSPEPGTIPAHQTMWGTRCMSKPVDFSVISSISLACGRNDREVHMEWVRGRKAGSEIREAMRGRSGRASKLL